MVVIRTHNGIWGRKGVRGGGGGGGGGEEFVCRALPLLSVHWTRVMLPGPEIGGCKA